jgi:hypothetical protein
MAGQATTMLKLPVSVQIVLRALINEGVHRQNDRALLANVERQARAVHRIRSVAPRRVPHDSPSDPAKAREAPRQKPPR